MNPYLNTPEEGETLEYVEYAVRHSNGALVRNPLGESWDAMVPADERLAAMRYSSEHYAPGSEVVQRSVSIQRSAWEPVGEARE